MANFTTAGSDTFPAGHLLQVKSHYYASNAALGTSTQNWPSTAIGFDNAIGGSSDVLMFFSATFIDSGSGLNNYTDVYFNGGGFGDAAGTGGRKVIDAEMYKNTGEPSVRGNIGVHTLDLAPGSTTPTYNLHFVMGASMNLTVSAGTLTFMEIAG